MTHTQDQSSSPGEPNLSNAPVGVFISHKSEDKNAAVELLDLLEVSSAGKATVHISEQIPPGEDWLQWIKEHLSNSNVLMLLFTNPRESWDWCLFEAGLFLDLGGQDFRRVVCLHHPQTDPPRPLRNLQTVPATQESLEEFLRQLFGETTITGADHNINEPLANNPQEITRLATRIEQLFRPLKLDPWFPHMRLVLAFEPQQVDALKAEHAIPADVKVTKADARTLAEAFGLGEGSYTWADLVARAERRGDTAWIDELARAMVEASAKDIDQIELTNTFRAARGGKIFRPVLYRVDFLDASPVKFHVLFTEELAPADVAGRGKLANVFQMLKIGHRFRWEVLQSYMGRMQELADEFSPEIACQRLREVIGVIEEETDNLRLLDPAILTAPFDNPDDRAALEGLLQRWETEVRQPLMTALADGEIAVTEEQLTSLRLANAEFLAICGKRYAELAEEELGHVPRE